MLVVRWGMSSLVTTSYICEIPFRPLFQGLYSYVGHTGGCSGDTDIQTPVGRGCIMHDPNAVMTATKQHDRTFQVSRCNT